MVTCHNHTRIVQVMLLVVLGFVILTSAAMLDAYGPCVGSRDIGKAAGCFIGLLVFHVLVSTSLRSV